MHTPGHFNLLYRSIQIQDTDERFTILKKQKYRQAIQEIHACDGFYKNCPVIVINVPFFFLFFFFTISGVDS